jgi:hypothetical protein
MKLVLFVISLILVQHISCKKDHIEPTPNNNNTNLPAVDTANIVKWPPSPGEVIIADLTWIFPWYNGVEVDDFSFRLPSGALFKVFIQRNNATAWEEVPPTTTTGKYEYFVEKRPDGAGIYNYGSLYIFYYGTDVNDTPSVKITY